MKRKTKKLAIIGPYPPPVGGISQYVNKLSRHLEDNFHIIKINEFENPEIPCNLSNHSKFQYAFRLFKCLLITNPDIIYYHGAHGISRFILAVWSKFMRKKLLLHFHGNSVLRFAMQNSLTKLMSRFYLKNAQYRFVVEKKIMKQLKNLFPGMDFHWMPAWIPGQNNYHQNKYNKLIINKLNLNNQYKWFLSYTNLAKNKNGQFIYSPLQLIRFFQREDISHKFGLLLLVIVKNSNDIEIFEKEILNKINLTDNIKIFFNEESIPLTAFMPYTEAYIRWTTEDGFPVSFLEAMEEKQPVIANKLENRPEFIHIFEGDEELAQIINTGKYAPMNQDLMKEFKEAFNKHMDILKKL